MQPLHAKGYCDKHMCCRLHQYAGCITLVLQLNNGRETLEISLQLHVVALIFGAHGLTTEFL